MCQQDIVRTFANSEISGALLALGLQLVDHANAMLSERHALSCKFPRDRKSVV